MVRAKFRVTSITRGEGSRPNPETGKWEPCEVRSVQMAPVVGNGAPENAQFWAATPSGRIEIGCANLEAAEQFELGKEYYVDFTPAN